MDFEIYLVPDKGESEFDMPINETKIDDNIYLTNPRTKLLSEFYPITSDNKLRQFSELKNLSGILTNATGIKDNEISTIIKGIINATIKTKEIAGYLSEETIDLNDFGRLFNNRQYNNGIEFDSLDAAVQLYRDNLVQVCINGKNNQIGYIPTQKLTTLLNDYSKAIR
jgi:hypothetical protein